MWIRKTHRWLAVVSAIPLFLLIFTGLLLVWEPELQAFEEREAAYVQAPGVDGPKHLSISDMEDSLAPVLEPGEKVQLYFLPEAANRSVLIRTDNKRYLFVNPYTGRVIKETRLPAPVMAGIRVLHTSFFLGRFGTWVGILASVAFCILAVTGIFLFSKRRGSLKKRLGIRFNKGSVRRNYDLHAVVGFWSAGLLALISLSGALIGVGQPWKDFILGVTRSEWPERPRLEAAGNSEGTPIERRLSPDLLLEKLNAAMPDGLRAGLILFPVEAEDPFSVRYTFDWARRPASWGFAHPVTGAILDIHHFPDFEPGHLIHRLNRGFHSGELFTAGMRWLWFALMLAALILMFTGYALWHRKQRPIKT